MNTPLPPSPDVPEDLKHLPDEEFLDTLKGFPPEQKTEALRKRCRLDLKLFAKYFFPHLCRHPWSRLHEYLFKRRQEKLGEPLQERQGRMDVILAPRGAAKSTLVSLIFPIHALLYRLEGYIVLISATLHQATQRLGNLRGALLQNEALKECFAEELKLEGRPSARTLTANTVRIEAYSAGAELRGIGFGPWRPSWVILDDAESSVRTRVARHRETLAEWFGEVIENLGDSYTNIDLVGTLLHREALPARLLERPDTTGQTFPSIQSEAVHLDLWEAWRQRFRNLEDPERLDHAREFFERNREAMLEGSQVLWPAKEDYYQLQVMRETRGRAAFDKEKQNAPWEDGSATFAGLTLRRFRLVERRLVCDPPLAGATGGPTEAGPPELDLDSLTIHGFLDPALGGSGGDGDFAAIVTVGVDASGYQYLLDVWLERASPSEQITRVFDLHEQWHYQGFGIEINMFQKLLLDPLAAEGQRRRQLGRLWWQLPTIERRNQGNKRLRVTALEPILRNGYLLLSDSLSEEFMNQFRDFPNGRHDDGPDALASCIEQIKERGGGPEAAPRSIPRHEKGASTANF